MVVIVKMMTSLYSMVVDGVIMVVMLRFNGGDVAVGDGDWWGDRDVGDVTVTDDDAWDDGSVGGVTVVVDVGWWGDGGDGVTTVLVVSL